jgi:flagellar biosynthesis anti-sigma factor FlgM
MHIELNGPATSQVPAESTAARVSNTGPTAVQGPAQDRTTFHSDGASIQALTNQALQSPEVRQTTVENLRQTVTSGQYNVDTTKVANAIVGNQ